MRKKDEGEVEWARPSRQAHRHGRNKLKLHIAFYSKKILLSREFMGLIKFEEYTYVTCIYVIYVYISVYN